MATDPNDDDGGQNNPRQLASLGRRCNGCGGLPRPPLHRLLRCSRCHSAMYHDAACQLAHYKAGHRKRCRAPVYHQTEQKDDGRGRRTVASWDLNRGERILGGEGESSSFWLVPPVLRPDRRTERCAYCFGRLSCSSYSKPSMENSTYRRRRLHHHCSERCRGLDGYGRVEEEAYARAHAALPTTEMQTRRVESLFTPVVLTMVRIMRRMAYEERYGVEYGTTTIRSTVETLVSNEDLSKPSERDGYEAISQVVLRSHKLHCDVVVDEDYKSQLLTLMSSTSFLASLAAKLSMNGFTIADGEQVPIGLGLCAVGCRFNHSCQPNAVQTYVYGEANDHAIPQLWLTTTRPIKAGEEITIAYIDVSPPKVVRFAILQNDYKFHCTCGRCCENDDDGTALNIQRERDAILERVSHLEETSSVAPTEDIVDELEGLHRRMVSFCHHLPTSWYARRIDNVTVTTLLDMANAVSPSRRRTELYHRALITLERGEINDNVNEWDLQAILTTYRAAKLRLYLADHYNGNLHGDVVGRALASLRCVHKQLSTVYPRRHEVLKDLEACMVGV